MAPGFAGPPDGPAGVDLDVFPRLLRASKLRVGDLRAQGVPAILLGSAAIVLAAGVSRSIRTIAPQLPEALRETKALLESARADARSLRP